MTETDAMNAIVVEGLCKQYPRGGRRKAHEALRSLSFSVPLGRHAALLGVNGAGKSTTVKVLAGCLRPDAGRVLIAGFDAAASRSVRRVVGYVPDGTDHLYGRWTVRENAAYYASLKGMRRSEFSPGFECRTRELGITALADRRVHGLSKGQRQRVAFLIALLHSPQVLLLDEPTTALDAESTTLIGRILKDYCHEGGSILLTSHDLGFVEQHADDILLLNEGRLVEQSSVARFLDQHAVDRYEMTLRYGTVEPSRIDLALRLAGVEASHDRGTTTLHCTADSFHAVIEALHPDRPSNVRNIGRELSSIIPRIAGGMRHALPA